MRKAWFVALSMVFVGLVVACGDGAQGESCDESGIVDGECDDGLVCGKKSDDSADLICLKQCSAQSDCSGTEDCNGVSGSSLKACRPRKGA
jgi:hypothetical protein